MPGATLRPGMDNVEPEMLSASKLSATRIIVESEHNPPASCAPPPPLFDFCFICFYHSLRNRLCMFILVLQV
jgi:hypothetical protein